MKCFVGATLRDIKGTEKAFKRVLHLDGFENKWIFLLNFFPLALILKTKPNNYARK